MSYVDSANIGSMVSGLLGQSPLIQALQALSQAAPQAAPAGALMDKATALPAGATVAPDKSGAATPAAAAPAASALSGLTPAQQAALATVQSSLGSGNPLGITPQNGTINEKNGDVQHASGVYYGLDPSQRWAGGGIVTGKTLDADAQTLPGLSLESESAANDAKKMGAGYAAISDQGDTLGQISAAPGQTVRLIDPTTGDVVAQGVGPQGADYIASLASAVSQKLGKQAQWDIAEETGAGSGKYNTIQGDRVDKPRFTLLSAIKDILPAALAMIPGVGPAIGGALAGISGGAITAGTTLANALGSGLAAFGGGLATGEKPLNALITGLGAGGGSFLGAGGFGGGAGASGAGAGGTFGTGSLDFVNGITPTAFNAGSGTFDAATALGGLGAGLGGGGGALGDVLGNGLHNPTAAVGSTGVSNADWSPSDLAALGPHAPVVDPMAGLGSSGGGGAAGALGAGAGGAVGGIAGLDYPNPVQEVVVNGRPPASTGPTIQPAAGLGDIGSLIPQPSGPSSTSSPPNNDAKNGSNVGKTVADLINSLINGGGGGGGGGTGTKSTTPDPFTPGGGSTGPSGTGGPQPSGVPSSPAGPGISPPQNRTTSPTFAAPALGTVSGSPFGSGGAGPAALGSINLKGSAAPDIYPWQTVV